MDRFKMTIVQTVNQYIKPVYHEHGSWIKSDDHKKEMESQKLSYENVCDDKDKEIERVEKEKEWLLNRILEDVPCTKKELIIIMQQALEE